MLCTHGMVEGRWDLSAPLLHLLRDGKCPVHIQGFVEHLWDGVDAVYTMRDSVMKKILRPCLLL